MGLTGQTFRVFVSSTFSDLKAERNALQENVFPKLKELCLQNGCRFQAIDLRWGVSTEASLDHQAMKICLNELKRCQEITPRPNFIVLLGDRYGWRPLPHEIPAVEFEKLITKIESEEKELIRWREEQPAENKGWYRRDDNAVPPVYCLEPRTGPWKDEAAWNSLEDALRRILLNGIGRLSLSPADRRRYLASATAQEIEEGVLGKGLSGETGAHVFCFSRTIEGLPAKTQGDHSEERRLVPSYLDLSADGQTDQDAQRSLDCLRDRLFSRLPGNFFFYEAKWLGKQFADEPPITTTHLDRLCQDAYQCLSRSILSQIRLLKQRAPMEIERAAHNHLARKYSETFLGRRKTLADIADYLAGDVPNMCVILGPVGSGKSALIAKSAEMIHRRQPQAKVLLRFIGSTSTSSSGIALMEDICQQLGSATSDHAEFAELAHVFRQSLAKASANEPIVLLLDGIDQLAPADPANQLVWLPIRLPPFVRLVVSCRSESSAAELLQRRLPADHIRRLPALTPNETADILAHWLERAGRSLTRTQWNRVVSVSLNQGTPLFLKLVFEEARLWRSFTPPITLPGDTPGLIRHLFTRLSREDHHGRLMVSRTLGYLVAARNGLSEDELLEVLSQDEDVLAEFYRRSRHDPPRPQLPVAVWSRLHSDLEPYLARRRVDNADLLVFFHRKLGEEAADLFLSEKEHLRRHRCLASFFSGQPFTWTEGERRLPNLRSLSELQYHLVHGGLKAGQFETFTDPDFLETKTAAGLSYDLLADLDRALSRWDCPSLHQLRQALAHAIPWMVRRPELALQCLFNRLNWAGPITPALRGILAQWEDRLDGRSYWIKAAAPIPEAGPKSGARFELETPTLVQSLSSNGSILAACADDGKLELRDTTQGGILDRRRLEPDGIEAIALREDLTVAYLTTSGSIGVEGCDAVFAGRTDENVLVAHPRHGIFGLTQQHSLVAWNPEENTFSPLVENLPQPLVALRLSSDGDLALFVGGRRPQVVGFSRMEDNEWRSVTFRYEGPPVVDADIDPKGQQALLLCMDRSLKLFRIENLKTAVSVLHYETRSEGFQGRPQKVRFSRVASSKGRAYFATAAGHIGSWYWGDDRVERSANFRRSVTDPSFLCLFEVLPDTDNLFYSTAASARSVSPTETDQSAGGHMATVSDCQITDTEQVVTLSELEQTVRWFTADGLSPLACQPSRHLSAMAVRPGSDEVFLGDSQGRFWVQSAHRPSAGQDQVQVMTERLVSLVPINAHQLLAAGKSGRLTKIDLKKNRSKIISSGSGFREQTKILPAGTMGVCWSLYQDEMGNKPLAVSLVSGVGRERMVLQTAPPLVHYDAAVSRDGSKVALAGKALEVFQAVGRKFWQVPGLVLQFRRETVVKQAVFLGRGELLGVIYPEEPWIEVWGVKKDLPTVAAAELPGLASCIGARASRMVVGLESGELLSLVVSGKHSV